MTDRGEAPTSEKDAAPDRRDQRIAELEAEVEQTKAENAQLKGRIARLKERIAQLEQRITELERAGNCAEGANQRYALRRAQRSLRQATPFARDEHKADPKRPGRKAGQGHFAYREKPTPDQVQETKEEPLAGCPDCGGPLRDLKEHEQFVMDLPEVRPQITRYITHSGYCGRCARRVRSRHPEQISTAAGAAGVMIGPRAKALAADLKHRLGVPFAKICEVLEVGFGLHWTRSGACQADARLAEQARPVYEELIELIRQCAVAHADETGWRIGILSAWLWVFTNQQVTVYTIRKSRGHDVVVDILGKEFAGVLSSDCFAAYDHKALAAWVIAPRAQISAAR